MLNLRDEPSLLAPQPVSPEKYRSPTIAFLLSVLCPGLGHLYIGLKENAARIVCAELASIAALFTTGPLHDAAVLAIPAIYCFAMIDAYMGARESNAGLSDLMIRANPRIAAILNLLTKGFGYFYIGDRAKGMICFFVIMAAQSILQPHMNIWIAIFAISLQVAISIDVYRASRQALLENHPGFAEALQPKDTSPLDVLPPAGRRELQPAAAAAITCAIGLILFAGYITVVAFNGHEVSSRGTIEQGPGGLTYRDEKEHFSLTLPEGWTSFPPKGSLALFGGDGASVLIQEQYASYSAFTLLTETRKQMLADHPDATVEPCSYPLAGRIAQCFEIQYKGSQNKPVSQRIFAIRRLYKLFILIESWADQSRPSSFDRIEQSLQVK
jgi:hypothetical protein